MAIIGACSLTLLPVALELAVELTRNANASTAMLWASSNLFSIILVLGKQTSLRHAPLMHTYILASIVQNSLREGPSATLPYSMHRAIEFQGILVVVIVAFVLLLKGEQTRRVADEQAQAQQIDSDVVMAGYRAQNR